MDDELYMLGGDPLDGFLNDMITILVLDTMEDMFFKLFDQLRLLIGQNVLERLQEVNFVERIVRRGLTFWTTRQPYICKDRVKTRFFIWLARIFFCDWLPCSKNFCMT